MLLSNVIALGGGTLGTQLGWDGVMRVKPSRVGLVPLYVWQECPFPPLPCEDTMSQKSVPGGASPGKTRPRWHMDLKLQSSNTVRESFCHFQANQSSILL